MMQDLARRYAYPIIVLNLVKSVEKRPRESLLYSQFARAIGYVNKQVLAPCKFAICSPCCHCKAVQLFLIMHTQRLGDVYELMPSSSLV